MGQSFGGGGYLCGWDVVHGDGVEVNKAELMTRLKAAFQRQRHVVELPQRHALIGLWHAG